MCNLSPCILIVAFLGVMRGYFQGHGTMLPTAVSQIIEQIINAVISVVLRLFSVQRGHQHGGRCPKRILRCSTERFRCNDGHCFGALTALIFLFVLYRAYTTVVKRRLKRERVRRLESKRNIYKILMITIAPVILSATLSNISNILDQAVFTNVMTIQGMSERKEYNAFRCF